MTFLNPWGLLALLSLPLVAFLHLRREQSRRWVVSNLPMWGFLEEQMRGGKMRRLPLTLLLILDLIIAALFALAFARPHISLPPLFPAPRHLVILLDDSASMAAQDVQPARFVQAVSDIEALLGTTGRRDIFTLITFGGEARVLGDTREISTTDLLLLLQDTQPVMQGVALETAFALANALSISDLTRELYIYTDAAYPAPEITLLDGVPIWQTVDQANGDNQAVLHIQQGGAEVFVELYNFSTNPVERVLQLYGDDILLAETVVALSARNNYVLVWPLYGEFAQLRVAFEAADNHPLDDAAHAITAPKRTASVLLVSKDADASLYVRALEAVGAVTLQTSASLTSQYYDLVVLVDQDTVDLPAGNVLSINTGGDYAFTEIAQPSGTHYTLSFEDDFLRSPEFPILIARIVDASRGLSLASEYVLGASYSIPQAAVMPSLTLTDPTGTKVDYGGGRTATAHQFTMPGLHQLTVPNSLGDIETYQVAVNAGDLIESDILPQFHPVSSEVLSDTAGGSVAIELDLMPWLLMLALILLWMEAIWAWR